MGLQQDLFYAFYKFSTEILIYVGVINDELDDLKTIFL
jgi:hypothetical protein